VLEISFFTFPLQAGQRVGGESGGLALISRQSFLSCETKFFAHLWKDLVFTAAKLVSESGSLVS